jgi:hypothetical protein
MTDGLGYSSSRLCYETSTILLDAAVSIAGPQLLNRTLFEFNPVSFFRWTAVYSLVDS